MLKRFFPLLVVAAFAVLPFDSVFGHRVSYDPAGVYMEHLEVTAEDGGGTLIFSDSPEYVKEDGILYADTVNGEARVLYYHLNDTTEQKKIAVLLQNEGAFPVRVTVKRRGDGEPTQNFSFLGKETQMQYFGDYQNEIKEIGGFGMRLLSDMMDRRLVDPGELVFGMYDFLASAPIKVLVVSYPKDTDPWTFLSSAKILPPDEHRLRGTFQGMNRYIRSKKPYNSKRDGIKCLMLVDNEQDPYKHGLDATDGKPVINEGNYGMVYHIELPTTGYGKIRYRLVPLGGIYAGAMRVSTDFAQGETISVPRQSVFFGEEPFSEAEDMAWHNGLKQGLYFLPENAASSLIGEYECEKNLIFNFASPGAANLPVYLVLEPIS